MESASYMDLISLSGCKIWHWGLVGNHITSDTECDMCSWRNGATLPHTSNSIRAVRCNGRAYCCCWRNKFDFGFSFFIYVWILFFRSLLFVLVLFCVIELIRNRKGLRERKKEEHLDSSSVEGEQMQYAVMVWNRISVFLAGDCIYSNAYRPRSSEYCCLQYICDAFTFMWIVSRS